MTLTPNNVVPIAIMAVVAVRMYGRVRRNIGRQPLRRKSMMARIILFAVLTCGFAVFSVLFPRLLIGLTGGLALGVILALVGLRLTHFEATPEGHFYTPNPYIGVGLSLLLVGRLVYRFFVISSASDNPVKAPPLMQSSLTLLVFGLLAGYYVAYYIGLLMRSKTFSAQSA